VREREREKAYQKLRLEAMNFKERRGLIDSKKLKQKTTSFNIYIYIYIYIYINSRVLAGFTRVPGRPGFSGPIP
jgi:hypothetical protein